MSSEAVSSATNGMFASCADMMSQGFCNPKNSDAVDWTSTVEQLCCGTCAEAELEECGNFDFLFANSEGDGPTSCSGLVELMPSLCADATDFFGSKDLIADLCCHACENMPEPTCDDKTPEYIAESTYGMLGSCDDLKEKGLCDPLVQDMFGMTGMVGMLCCETCEAYEEPKCDDFDFATGMVMDGMECSDIIRSFGSTPMPEGQPKIDLCKDDTFMGMMLEADNWEVGTFSDKLCCDSCTNGLKCRDKGEDFFMMMFSGGDDDYDDESSSNRRLVEKLAASREFLRKLDGHEGEEEQAPPFVNCQEFSGMGMCNPAVAEFVGNMMGGDDDECADDNCDDDGMPPGFGELVCCNTCKKQATCSNYDGLIAMVGGAQGITTCAAATGMMPALCENDALLATMVPEGVVWTPGLFSDICCAACKELAPSPAATVVTKIPAKMNLVLEEVPAAGSPALKVLALGLKETLQKAVPAGADVKIISIGGNAVGVEGRRLADAEVVFEVIFTSECSTADCAGEVPSVEDAAAMSENVAALLTEATADPAVFTAALAESMEKAAEQLVADGEITAEEGDAAAAIEVVAEAVVVEEAVVEEVVVAESPTTAPTDAPTAPETDDAGDDETDDTLTAGSSALKVGVLSAVAAFAVAVIM
jgi:hypothetical protein